VNHSLILHHVDDSVGVAIRDLESGERLDGAVVGDAKIVADIQIVQDIPFGHKVAVVLIPDGDMVIEYGLPIGRASETIERGQLVHTQNLGSMRWAR